MKLDGVMLEILGTKVTAIAEEMGITLQRTGRTIYVKETADFGTALVSRGGEFFGFPQVIGVVGFVGLNCKTALDAVGPLEPGDVVITNHPYRTAGLSTHLPDVHLIKPYFVGDTLICYGWCFVHSADIGGKVPSSISPSNTEIFQEGLMIPPLKLLRRGEWNDDVLKFYGANCRTPELNLGDMRAMLAALEVGEKRIGEMIEDYGLDAVLHAQEDLLAYAQEGARRALQKVPDGKYTFWDYLDDGLVNNAPVRVRVKLTVEDGRVHIDFRGTDAESNGPINMPSAGMPHPWLVLRLAAFAHSYAPQIVVNGGMLRNVSVDAPEGSLVNPGFPAPVGVRAATGLRVYDAVSGALAQACVDKLPACPSGTVVPVVLVEPTERSAETKVAVIQFMVGATGAREGHDGIDGRDPGMSSMANNPTEIIEREASITVLDYGVRADSGGAGTYRGGCGQRYRFRVEKDGCEVLARGIERMRFPPWGLVGGMPGACLRIVLARKGEKPREIAKFETLALDRGDVVEILMPGGGGYGSPIERDPHDVLRDVELGFVSARSARERYGVVVRSGRIDARATAARRAALARFLNRSPRPLFDFGPERAVWERCFDDRDQTAIAELLQPLARMSRNSARAALLRGVSPALADAAARGQPLDRVLKGATRRNVRQGIRALAEMSASHGKTAAPRRGKRHG